MNCHHARQLISPYLDHQLTGREMLALQDHFAICTSCEREMYSIRQVKVLLRGLQEPRLPRDFSGSIALRLEQMETGSQGWRVLSLPAPNPPRGRRLASALALSCLTVLSFVAPFAPDAARSTSSLLGYGGAAFPAPASSDPLLSGSILPSTILPSTILPSAILSGRMPERGTLIPQNDLTRLPPAEAAAMPQGNVLILSGLDSAAPTSLELTARSQDSMLRPQDATLGNVQFAVFRPR